MKTYRTTGILDLFCGRIGLVDTQAAPRGRSLRRLGDGLYEVVSPVQFKAGEVLRLDDLPKTVLGRLECLDIDEEPEAVPEPERVVDQSPAPPADGKHRGRRKQRR